MHNSVDWILIGKVLAGEATDIERQQVDDWLAAHPEHRPVIDDLRRFWLTSDTKTSGSNLDVASAFERLQKRIAASDLSEEIPVRPMWNPQIGSRWTLVRWAVAASAILAITVGGWNWFRASDPDTLVQQTNPKGTRSQIRLADGSTVWLNADSHLSYPKTFTGQLREVSLEGEAFFQVAHNARQPFVVRLKTGSVRVLGTSFNIRSYPGDSTVETSVVTGRVAFVPKPGIQNRPVKTSKKPAVSAPDTLFLTPNTKAIQSLTRRQVVAQPTVAANQMAWTESRLVFRNTPMGEVAKTLERWYGTPVTLERESLRHCPLTGTFQNQSLREVMSLIAMTNRFEYELTPSQVTIKGTGCEGDRP